MTDTASETRRTSLFSKILVLTLAALFLFGLLGFFSAVLSAREADPEPSPAVSSTGSSGSAQRILLAVADPGTSAVPSVSPSVAPSADPSAAPSPAASPLEAEAAAVILDHMTPNVPVARFWSKVDSIKRQDLVRALQTGKIRGHKRLVVDERLREPLEAELGFELHEDVRIADAPGLKKAVSNGALGLLAATDLSPGVRALEINGRSLIGNDRVRRIEDWPLTLTLPTVEGEGWDQGDTWVLVAGGDSFTDRGVYDSVVKKGRGVDYPFDGGTARITGYGCCDPVFNDNVVPRYQLTGNKGRVRKLFMDAELAIANHEAPVTDDWAFHSSGTRFSGKPELTRIFTRAGIDWVSLANNHIKDYGAKGIKDTRRILRKAGIDFGGAGKDLDQARKVTYLDAGDTRVAIIPCLDIVKIYWAEAKSSGATPCLDRHLVPDIKKAKRNADVVIVFPHWGVEYTRQPLPSMRRHAARWTKAGADMVLGAHSHVAGAIEELNEAPVFYSLGNLIFDQHWSTNTMISMVLEATFHRDQVAEVRLRPYIIHNTSQPNLLDPDSGGGRSLLKQVRSASKDWLDW
jgi:poly-gamma-glutamate capsule biosynthesis protein CapA/YwtB (metallophosphatase superfamily)